MELYPRTGTRVLTRSVGCTSIRRSMGEAECYEPSSLITSIHKGVPFLTDADVKDKSAELVLNLDEGTKEFYAYFVVSVRVRVRVRCFFTL